MKLEAIFWTDPYGQTELIAITNNTKKWLEINNKFIQFLATLLTL